MPPKKKQAVGEDAPAPAAGVGASKLDLARGDTISPSSETFSPLLEPESEASSAGAVGLKPEKEQQQPAEKQKVRTEHPTGAPRARADPVHVAQRAPGSPRKSHKRRHKFKDHLPRPKGLLIDDGLRVFWDAPPTAPPRQDEEGSDAAAALEGSIDWKSLGATSPRDDAAVVLPGVSTLPASQYNDLLLTNPYRPPPTYLRCAGALARLPAPRGEFLLCADNLRARARWTEPTPETEGLVYESDVADEEWIQRFNSSDKPPNSPLKLEMLEVLMDRACHRPSTTSRSPVRRG